MGGGGGGGLLGAHPPAAEAETKGKNVAVEKKLFRCLCRRFKHFKMARGFPHFVVQILRPKVFIPLFFCTPNLWCMGLVTIGTSPASCCVPLMRECTPHRTHKTAKETYSPGGGGGAAGPGPCMRHPLAPPPPPEF